MVTDRELSMHIQNSQHKILNPSQKVQIDTQTKMVSSIPFIIGTCIQRCQQFKVDNGQVFFGPDSNIGNLASVQCNPGYLLENREQARINLTCKHTDGGSRFCSSDNVCTQTRCTKGNTDQSIQSLFYWESTQTVELQITKYKQALVKMNEGTSFFLVLCLIFI